MNVNIESVFRILYLQSFSRWIITWDPMKRECIRQVAGDEQQVRVLTRKLVDAVLQAIEYIPLMETSLQNLDNHTRYVLVVEVDCHDRWRTPGGATVQVGACDDGGGPWLRLHEGRRDKGGANGGERANVHIVGH
jgi:hypothetical protein